MAKQLPKQGKHWTAEDTRELRALAAQNTPTRPR